MALLQATFKSASLKTETSFNIILPENCQEEDIPTLYLLHGRQGSHSCWARKTCIEQYVKDRNIAVIMPDGDNSYYTDMKYGKKYYTYVTEELVDYTRRILKLSHKREKTFICGLSMGGYGAVRAALKKPEQYAAAASLSGALDIVDRVQYWECAEEPIAIWGENYKTSLSGSDADLFWLINSFPNNAPRPRIYSACGKQDSLYKGNITFCDFMYSVGKEKGFEFKFEEADGQHNWEFWNKWIVPALDFILEG